MKIDIFLGGIFAVLGGLIFAIRHEYFSNKLVSFWNSVNIKTISKMYLVGGIIFLIFGLFMIFNSFLN